MILARSKIANQARVACCSRYTSARTERQLGRQYDVRFVSLVLRGRTNKYWFDSAASELRV